MTVNVAIVSTDETARMALVRSLEKGPSDWVLSLHREPPTGGDVIVCSPEVACAGALVVDPIEPGDVVARVERLTRPRPRVVAVTSAEGGAGVTTIALHLAGALAGGGCPTAFVDLDPARAAHERLGIEAVPAPEGPRPVPVPSGFRFVAGVHPAGLHDALPEDTAWVVLDVPLAAFSDVARRVDAAILLIRPTPRAAQRARAVVDAYREIAWCPVVNRLGRGGQTTAAQLDRILGGRVFELPPCPALRDVEEEHRLLSPGWSRWSRRVRRLADALAR
ncbi:MAG TPA: hypothetical protein VG929_12135 [Actinomycetota bacterium]|nr:hypothetical protein [Actinomycetota bacterium]